jgi:predicted acylesterase/phospholipase RssA
MQYDLVFEGGGAKGMVFVGALEEFFSRGHSFDRLLGTSAGAITATLLAAGYTPEEMLEALAEKEDGASVFSGFMGRPPAFSDEEIENSATLKLLQGVKFNFLPDRWEQMLDSRLARALAASERFRHLMALVERGGWFAADRFVTWLCARLDAGECKGSARSFSRLSLSHFFDRTGVELSLVASDTCNAAILVLNRHTAPDCPLVWAVRMSMSIPLVWNEVIWQRDWGLYLGQDLTGHAIVDGGLLSNFPIELLISGEPHVVRLMGNKRQSGVLGMLIDERLPVPGAKGLLVTIDVKTGDLKTLQRLRALVDTATTAHDKMVIEEHSDLVVRLPAGGYGTTEFEMSDERRAALVDAGRVAMALYFDAPEGLLLPRSGAAKAPGAPPLSAADRIAVNILSPAAQPAG